MKRFLVSAFLFSLIAGCATNPKGAGSIDTTNLGTLENLTTLSVPASAQPMGNIRGQAIKETASTLGSQAGLAWEAEQINTSVKANTAQLDNTFNFGELLLANNVLPPVLQEGNQLANLSDADTLRIADRTYKIVQQARFVTSPPNWRSYLVMNYSKPDVPDRSLLPKTPDEQKIWATQIQRSWIEGIQQAKLIYQDNLSRLKRDYNGMLLYRELLDRNMVSKPFVASTSMGVTSNASHSQLYINDKVLRITALPELNPDASQWRPVITP